MDRRLRSIFISILLISTLSITIRAISDNIIYVDDDNTSGPWDGTLKHPYRFIQQAIDNASDGDTIFVFNGIYYEDITIWKEINLFGEDKNKTIIHGFNESNTISICANYVNLMGFKIVNGYYGLEINSSHYVMVSNCSILNTIESSVYIYRSSNIDVLNFEIYSNGLSILVEYSSNISLYGNDIVNDVVSPSISIEHSNYNVIQCNEIYSIRLDYSSNNLIAYNNYSSLFLSFSSYNIISWNNIDSNGYYSIQLYYSGFNSIIRNNFIGSRNQVFFYNSFSNTWYNNYWSDWSLNLPRPIVGSFHIFFIMIPWLNFDWHPVKEPWGG